jgi:nucleoside-diphosphate-sugar epimerase
MVHISCADVTLYDGPRSFWNEDQAPTRPYGHLARTKLHAEELVRVSGKKGFWTCALRPALVWGPGDTTHLPRWQSEASSGGIRLVGGGKKLMATTYIDNLSHATSCALKARVSSGNVYYVVDAELSVCREFFTELSEALRWPLPRRAGPYRWAWIWARAGLSSLDPTEVIRRGRSSAFDTSRARRDLGYEPPVTREQAMAELAAWYAGAQGIP